MQPTGISESFIENLAVITLNARRVMPGVRPLLDNYGLGLDTPVLTILLTKRSITAINLGACGKAARYNLIPLEEREGWQIREATEVKARTRQAPSRLPRRKIILTRRLGRALRAKAQGSLGREARRRWRRGRLRDREINEMGSGGQG